MLHEKLQVSPGLATPSPPSEQVVTPLLGLANDEQNIILHNWSYECMCLHAEPSNQIF